MRFYRKYLLLVVCCLIGSFTALSESRGPLLQEIKSFTVDVKNNKYQEIESIKLKAGHYLVTADQSDIDVRISIESINSKLNTVIDSIFERGIVEESYFELIDEDTIDLKVGVFKQAKASAAVNIRINKIEVKADNARGYIQALKLESHAFEVSQSGNKKHSKQSLNQLLSAQKIWKKLNLFERLAKNQMLTAYVAYYNYQWDDAVNYFSQASLYYQNNNQRKYAKSLYYLAATKMEMQLYQEALELLKKAKLIQQNEGFQFGLATTVNFLGNLAYYQGQYELASRYFLQASELFDSPNSQHKKATALANYGVIQISIGNYLNAIKFLNNSLGIYSDDNQYEYATTLVNIAYAQRKFGYLQSALVTYKKALRLHKKQNNKADIARVLKGMANLSRTILDRDTALLYQQQAVKIARNSNEHGALPHALIVLAKDYHYMGVLNNNDALIKKSEDQLTEALKITKNHKLKSEVLLEQSIQSHKQSRFEKASALLQRAKQELELSNVSNSAMPAKILLQQIKQNDFSPVESIGLLKQAQKHLKASKETELSIHIGLELSKLMMQNLQYSEADIELTTALNLYENLREKAGNPWIKNNLTQINYQIIEAKLELLPHLNDTVNDELGFEMVEKAKLSSYREQLADSKEMLMLSIDAKSKQNLEYSQQALISSLVVYEKLKLKNKDAIAIQNAKERILKEKFNLESQRANFYQINPKLASLIYPKPISFGLVNNWLKSEEKRTGKKVYFINYFIGKESGYGWLIGADRRERWKLLDIQNLQKDVENYISNISQHSFNLKASLAIKQQLIPVRLEKNATIYIASDGFLSGLPFSTLLTEEDSRLKYWIESDQLSIIPSVSTFIENEKVEYKSDHLLLVSGPLSSGGKLLEFTSTDSEINAIQQSWDGDSKTFFHHEKSLQDFLHLELDQFRYLHFATHAISDDKISELSGLAFENHSNIEYLNLSQIYGLKLASQLVTLSACDSGIGKNVVGEGLISLARGFLYAGSESVLATLWQIPDRASKIFMVRFYHHLSESFSPIEALNKTQNAAIQGKLGRTLRSPNTWAAFTLITN